VGRRASKVRPRLRSNRAVIIRREAADAGFRQTKTLAGTKHPRLQSLTIEELLAGIKIDMPTQQDVSSFKQAPKAKSKKKDDQHTMF
jgi:hypothetical protein